MTRLRTDALAIWQAALRAVASDRLVRESVRVSGRQLRIGDSQFELADVRQIEVVGAGKAGAGMAAGLEQALGGEVAREKRLDGWVNVPADCTRPLSHIHLHAARPAGVNEPTAAGVAGTQEILRRVGRLTEHDLCIALISGGGSALLPAPIDAISLEEKQALTRYLSAAGANIHQLNTVRKKLSKIKGGGLARACRAGHLVTLIISDVVGDPLDVIASGPTVTDRSSVEEAWQILQQFGVDQQSIAPQAVAWLSQQARQHARPGEPQCDCTTLVIGNNALAVDAAGQEAERLGYVHAMHAAQHLDGAAEDVGQHLADMALGMRRNPGPDCLITGGEPTVELVEASQRGRGGRNQQLVLAALQWLLKHRPEGHPPLQNMALLSAGTDGEDGPTDAAGAVIDQTVAETVGKLGLAVEDHLARNDAYSFFSQVDGLIRTGPTHTNVCDVRVVVVDRPAVETVE